MIRLACPICEEPGPWASAQERMTHIRAHHTVDCELCGRPVNASGLDAHMRYIHRGAPVAEQAPAPPVPDDAPAVEAEQVDDQAPDVDDVAQPAGEAQVDDPPRVDDPGSPSELRCDRCDAGPFAGRRGLAAHRRSHETVTCEVCDKPVKANGLGPHMAAHRRAAEPVPAEPAAPAPVPDQHAEPEPVAHAPEPEPPAPPPAPEPPADPPPPRIDRNARVACPDCDEMVRPHGLGSHRASHRRAAAQAAALPPAGRPLGEVLAELLPGAADELVDRLASFVEKHEPDAGHGRWVVATAEGGPWLCRTAGISLLVARENVPCIVVALDDIYAHTGRPAATGLDAGRSWPPHRKAAAS